MRIEKSMGMKAGGFHTRDKTNSKRHFGFANASLPQNSLANAGNEVCGQCKTNAKLYSGGAGRSLLLCGDCLLPSISVQSDKVDVVASVSREAGTGVRTIRLVQCYVCERPRSSAEMSMVPVVCRDCIANDGSRRSKLRIEKAILRVSRAIRRAACI